MRNRACETLSEIELALFKLYPSLEEENNLSVPAVGVAPAPGVCRQKLKFYAYGSLICMMQFSDGFASIFSLLRFLMPHIANPVNIPISILFGVFSASISMVFDLKAVADVMQVRYLTASRYLTQLLAEEKRLIRLNQLYINATRQLRREALLPNADLVVLAKRCNVIEALFTKSQAIQIKLADKISAYKASLDKKRPTLLCCKYIWTGVSTALFAGYAVISAMALLGVLTTAFAVSFPPALGVALSIAWIGIEVYRFLTQERTSIEEGVDSFFRSPLSKMQLLFHKKTMMEDKGKEAKEEIKLSSRTLNLRISERGQYSNNHSCCVVC